jgi:arylsulfatase A-like enzyme
MNTEYGKSKLTNRTAVATCLVGIRSLTRRLPSFFVWLCCIVIAFWATSVSAQDKGSPARPNVLMIAVDDLNDWLGCMGGHPQAISPHIDQLASRGTLFTNAHCQGPICGPSRASLLSGRYPHSTGVYQQPSGRGLEEDSEFFAGHLLPEYFAKHGYRTLGCGKITHGYSAKKAFQEFGGTFGGFGPKPKKRFHYHLPDAPWSGTQTDWGGLSRR